jgi:hypothetical protein
MAILIIYLVSLLACLGIDSVFSRMMGIPANPEDSRYWIPLMNSVVAVMLVLSILTWIGKGRN